MKRNSFCGSQISYYVHEVFIVQLFCYYPIGNSDWKLKEVCQLQNLYWTFVIFEKCTWQILNFCWLYGLQQTDLDPHQIDQNPSCWVLGCLVFNRLNCIIYVPKSCETLSNIFQTLFRETFPFYFWNIF